MRRVIQTYRIILSFRSIMKNRYYGSDICIVDDENILLSIINVNPVPFIDFKA